MKKLTWTAVIICLILLGCVSVKPYEKEYLLNPVMDDKSVSALNSNFANSICGENEKLSSSAPSSGSTSSCPTCGG